MTIRNDLTINWGISPRIIEVAAPSTELVVQDLYDTIRSKAAAIEGMDEPEIIDGSGKEILSATEAVGLTVKLLNSQVKFEDRAGPDWIDCSVSGGNLVAVDAYNQQMNPIAPAAYVTVTIAKSVSATLIAAIAEWTQAEKGSIFADTGTLKTDTEVLKTDTGTIKTEIDRVQHAGPAEYEPEKESLEAIRDKLDEIAEKIGAPAKKGFDL